MNPQLLEIHEEANVRVIEIEDDPEVRSTLGYLGITEGTRLKVLPGMSPENIIAGPLEIFVNNQKAIIGQGVALMVVLEKKCHKVRLNQLNEGESGIVMEIQGGEDAKDHLWNLKIEVGAKVELLRHLPDDILDIEIETKIIQIGVGKASKIWVKKGNQLIQLNYVNENESVTVTRVDGGEITKKDFNDLGISEGKKVMLKKRTEKSFTVANVDKAVIVEVQGHEIRLGHGLASKIKVEKIRK